MLLALIMIGEKLHGFQIASHKPFACIAACILIAQAGYWGVVYAHIGECSRTREYLIAEAVQSGAKELSLPAYPFEDHLHASEPVGASRLDYFKEFYGIPSDVTVTFVHNDS